MSDKTIERRNYLKYAGTGIIALGIFGMGWYLYSNRVYPSTIPPITSEKRMFTSSPSRSPRSTTTISSSSFQIEKEQLNPDLNARLNEYAQNIIGGGPPKDGIPPIDNPRYTSISSMDNFLDENDVVFLIELSDPVKIFPQKILVWHEIVNDQINGEKTSLTYCPLAGSAIGFKGRVDGIETTFGTSGKLVNSNLVLYDRATDSLWPQILGTAISGKKKGTNLQKFPVVWTRWNKAKKQYPDAQVLSLDTGFTRSYGEDPYGSYQRKNTYYDSGDTFFPLMTNDDRLPKKEVVVGVTINNARVALVKRDLNKDKVMNLTLDNKQIAAFYDETLDTIQVYHSTIHDNILNFETRGGRIKAGNSEWNIRGEAITGEMKGTKLTWVDSFDVMWFGWSSFYPETDIYK